MSTAISHFQNPLESIDWTALFSAPPDIAADAINSIVSGLDRIEKSVFAVRGRCLLLMEGRKLYQHIIDPATSLPFVSTGAWIRKAAPYSFSDCYAAMRTMRDMGDVPLPTLIETPRSNIEAMSPLSAADRREELELEDGRKVSVTEAARTLKCAHFEAEVRKRFPDLHLEKKRIFKARYSETEYAEVSEYLDWVGKQAQPPIDGDMAAQLLYLAVHENEEHHQ